MENFGFYGQAQGMGSFKGQTLWSIYIDSSVQMIWVKAFIHRLLLIAY